jgi:zinc transport system permease protein
MALGIILISLKKGYSFDLESYLFGNVLLVSPSEIYQLVILAFTGYFLHFFLL